MVPNGQSYFLPASLSVLGGARIYVQATAPTGIIPLNSLWFNTTTGSIEVWNGSTWNVQQFNAQQLIQADTILAAQIANGTLTTAQLAAAAGILGAQIATATITSGNIAANTIVAANIAANTITAAQIAANTITAGQIAAGTITSTQIAALAVSGANTGAAFHGLNMVPDPQFSIAAINTVRQADAQTAGTWTTTSGTAEVTASPSVQNQLALMPSAFPSMWVNPGEQYYLSVEVVNSAANNVGIGLICNPGGTFEHIHNSFTGTQTLTGTVTIPAGVQTAYVVIFAGANASTPTSTFSTPVCTPAQLNGDSWTLGANGLTVTSGTESVNVNDSQISLGSGAYISDSSTGQLVIGGTVGTNAVECLLPFSTIIVPTQPGSTTTEETWHSLGTAGATGCTLEQARYRITPDGECEIDIALLAAAGGSIAGTYTWSNTLPAGYQFTGNFLRNYPLIMNTTITTGTQNPCIVIDGNGTANAGRVRITIPAIAAGAYFTGTCRIPLN
jgi:hypothetical protein